MAMASDQPYRLCISKCVRPPCSPNMHMVLCDNCCRTKTLFPAHSFFLSPHANPAPKRDKRRRMKKKNSLFSHRFTVLIRGPSEVGHGFKTLLRAIETFVAVTTAIRPECRRFVHVDPNAVVVQLQDERKCKRL